MKPAKADISNRGPVWRTLSNLFLDTNLEQVDLEYIALGLAASPYTIEEIEGILFDEVYPICIWNLRAVAGNWAGFDGDALQEAILRRLDRPLKIPRYLHVGHWMIRDDWKKVKKIIHELRR
jgi:hypothetical protein